MKKRIFKLSLLLIAAALVFAAGFSRTAQVATAQTSPETSDACVRKDPTLWIVPAKMFVSSGKNNNASYQVTVINNDNAACGDSTFEVSSVAPAGWQSTLGSSSLTIAPHALAQTKMAVTGPQIAKPNNYLFAVTVSNSFDYSRQAGATATLRVMPSHIFSLSQKVANSGEVNVSNEGDLRWDGLVMLTGEQSTKMVQENLGLVVSITGADKKTREYNMMPQNGLVQVTEAQESNIALATQSELAGPQYTADGGRAAAYKLTGRRWNQRDPQVFMQLHNDANFAATGLTTAGALAAIDAAGNAWDDATNQNLFSDSPATLTNTENWKLDGVNNIAFRPYAAGCSALASTGTWYQIKGVTAGQYYPIQESDMSFNTNYRWSTSGSGGYDFQTVATHELGHTIGLGDLYLSAQYNNDTRQMMHYYTGLKRVLGNGDRTGIWTLYDGSVPAGTTVPTDPNVPTDTVAPSVSLTAPSNGSSYTAAQTVTISATASDNVGVNRVEFYDGATRLVSDSTSPYSYSWAITSAKNGNHTLTAKAYDAKGNVGTSNSATVTINIPANTTDTVVPTVSISAPANNSIISSTTNIVAAASDNVGVARVEFYDGSTLLNTATASPYSFAWNTIAAVNGAHSLTAKAYDAANNSKVSTAVSVTVNNTASGDITAPVVSLAYPTALTVNGITNIIANATDNVGVTKVEFYIAGVLKITDTDWPYEYAWDTSATGNVNQALMVIAYDTSNNARTVSKTVTVSNSASCTSLPAITILSPADGATVVKGQTYTVSASATDPDGIKRIYLYTDSTSLGYCLAGTCSKTWKVPTTTNSSYVIRAHVDDNKYCSSDATIVVGAQ